MSKSTLKIYHNPSCSKSRQCLALLKEKGYQPQVIAYLKDSPSFEELELLLDQLGIKAEDLIRKKEAIFKENFKGKKLSEKEWVQVLVDNPRLIERPIVVKENRAAIGRPIENILALLND